MTSIREKIVEPKPGLLERAKRQTAWQRFAGLIETRAPGQKRASRELRRKGVTVSSGVRSIRATILRQRRSGRRRRRRRNGTRRPMARSRATPRLSRLSGQPGHLRRG